MKTKIQILHVDDNSLDRQLVKDALCKEHDTFEVIEADSREKFEQYLAEKDFDIVLSDFNILGFDGLQVLQIVHEKDSEIPVIIVTGTGSEEVAIQAMKMGASDYVIKSAKHIRGLAPTIEQVLEKKRLRHEKAEALDVLKINEKKYRLLFDSNPHPMWVYDLKSLNFLEVNHSAILKYGYSRDEFLTMNLKDIRPPVDIEKLYENVRQDTDEYTFSGEWRHKNKKGDVFLVEIISHSISFNDKKARLVLANDITERKKTEDKLKLYTRAMEQSPVSLNITDKDGNIIYVNSGFTALSGYSFEEVLGKNPRFLKSGIHPDEMYKELWGAITSGKNWYGELCNITKNGDLYWVQANISPVVNSKGKITHFVAVKEDITGKKKMIEELIKTKEKAVESDKLKTSFLQNLSHEIRTPMNGILGFTDLLKSSLQDPKVFSQYIEVIELSGNRLMRLITDLIDISKIETGQIHLENVEFNVNNIISELEFFFKNVADEKRLEVRVGKFLPDSDCEIVCDNGKLFQILSNLLYNAIKFSEKGVIEFGCEWKGSNIEFYVKDQGIGIPKEKQSAIFTRFVQGDTSISRGYEGAGLGLSICKAYVEKIGGNIWVESEPGVGSIFYFSIPHQMKNHNNKSLTETLSSEKVSGSKTKLKMLIVDDDIISLLLLEKIITEISGVVLLAKNGREAIDICKKNADIDIILMDLKMPKLDGYGATQEIRKFNKNVVIIAQTAYAYPEDKEKALKSGCNDFVTKPLNREVLIKLINNHMK